MMCHCLAVDLPWHDVTHGPCVTSVAEGCFILQRCRPDRPTERGALILPGLHQSFDDVDIGNLLTDLSQPIS